MGLLAGMAMVVIGVMMKRVAGLAERFLAVGASPGAARPHRHASRRGGCSRCSPNPGAIGGAVSASACATHNREEVRIIGGIVGGAGVGAVLRGRWYSSSAVPSPASSSAALFTNTACPSTDTASTTR